MFNRLINYQIRIAHVAALLLLTSSLVNAVDIPVSNNPLFLPTPLDPNIIVTLDDSGSMSEAFVPELCGATWTGWYKDCECKNYGGTFLVNSSGSAITGEAISWCKASTVGQNLLRQRRFHSSKVNGLAYNPSVTYLPPVKANGDELPTSFAAAHVNGFWTVANGFATNSGTVDLSTNYKPVFYYNPSNNGTSANVSTRLDPYSNGWYVTYHPIEIDATSTGVPPGVAAYYYIFNSALGGCDGDKDNESCYQKKTVGAQAGPADLNGDGLIDGNDEKLNFANWYSFYKVRNFLTVSGASRAFSGLKGTYRLAWQSLTSCNTFGSIDSGFSCSGWVGDSKNNGMRQYSTNKSDFYYWLFRMPASGATPLRGALNKAGAYYSTNGKNSPYAQDPQVNAGTEYTCRPNFHILMTDGVWNGDGAMTYPTGFSSNQDSTSLTLPDGTAYSSKAPYQDTNSNSLSDLAYFYWATDLRADLSNDHLPYSADRTGDEAAQYWNAKNDPAKWQHMVNFTVGLGLTDFLLNPAWAGDTYAGGYGALKAGTANWPVTGDNTVPGNVYDLWHAAINSRGQFFSADSPESLASAFATVLDRVSERESSAAALATNSTRLGTDTVVYQARFDSTDWTGQIIAFPVGGDGTIGNLLWDAATLIPAHGARNIYSWDGADGIQFNWTALKAAGLAATLDAASVASASSPVLDYLRGDQSNEFPNGNSYRKRARRLGDVINSDPIFVGAQDFGYSSLPSSEPEAAASYSTFSENNKTRTKMIYVGANDGMMHAFNAVTGVEAFAYVPKSVITANLATLKDATYSHKYFVDGSPFVGDAFIGSVWKTVLIGTTGAGAKSLFALDVTNPDRFTVDNVLWEFSHAELGYTIGQPVIARLRTGEWAVIFGNGYNSTSHKAQLFIVNIATGALIKKIDTEVGSAVSPNQNGLATPTLYDQDGDKIVDIVYAGDLLGNVWKFDISNANSNSWDVAYKQGATPKPLFTACRGGNADADCTDVGEQIQPITGPVEIGSPPSGKTGVMVFFGTGRFFATGDNTDYVSSPGTSVQSLYGILDEGSRISDLDRSVLQQQSIIVQTTDPGRTDDASTTGVNEARAASTEAIRVVSQNSVNYAAKVGWYIDLLPPSGAVEGERVTSVPLLRHGRVIFTTLVPSTDPCKFGGTSWLMELDASTGGQLTFSVFDLDQNAQFNSVDYVTVTVAGYGTITVPVSGIRSKVGIIKTPTVISAGEREYKLASGTTGAVSTTREKGSTTVTGRASWRELINE